MLKNIFLLFFCATLSQLQAHEIIPPNQNTNQNGRYQISTASDDRIYLLDTQNGKVWEASRNLFGHYHEWLQLPLPSIEE